MNIRSYTAALVRNARSNFYYAFVFLPRSKRDAIFAAYAFSRHTDDLVDDAASREAAARNLAKWRAETHACFDGRPAHPITVNLHKALKRFRIPKEHFLKLIDGVEMDLVKNRYQTFGDLYEYCYRVASIVGLICIEIFGYTRRASREYAVNLGIALQLTNILRDIETDAKRDRIYLPLEDLKRFNCTEKDLFDGITTHRFRKLMQFQCKRARSYYTKAAQCLPREDRQSLFPAEIMGCIYSRLLSRIEAVNYNVYQHPIRVSNLKKLGIALEFCLRNRIGIREKSP
ncbi:MAG: presqualene diphosphate synthase HpnD [Gemmatimonadota bacterium]|nr:presqualene diphosphate synthase HpnD [Gemmatimonadota bacterium]